MRMVCFGDSNTYGYDPHSWFGGQYEAVWPDLLAKQTGWEIINAGENGREIPRRPYDILRVTELLNPAPDIFLVMLGTNDLLQGASAAETSTRMEQFLTRLFPACKAVLLLAPPAMKRGAWVPEDALVAESRQLAAAYRALAARLGIFFADAADWDLELTFDGVHLSENAHQTFAKCLQIEIQTILEK